MKIIEDINTNATATIHLDNDISEWTMIFQNPIQINREVRQGDTISPKIFTAAMEEIFKKLYFEKQWVNIDGEWLTNLRFEDVVVLTTPSVKDMEVHLNSLKKKK